MRTTHFEPPITLPKIRFFVAEEEGVPLVVMLDCAWNPSSSKDDVMAWSHRDGHVPCSIAYARSLPDIKEKGAAFVLQVFRKIYRDRVLEEVANTTKATWET